MDVSSLARYRNFVKELFQIVEWAIVVAAILVAGKKLDIPLATGTGYVLYAFLCFYVGLRVDHLFGWARYGDKPRKGSYTGMTLSVLGASVFGMGLYTLVHAIIAVTLRS